MISRFSIKLCAVSPTKGWAHARSRLGINNKACGELRAITVFGGSHDRHLLPLCNKQQSCLQCAVADNEGAGEAYLEEAQRAQLKALVDQLGPDAVLDRLEREDGSLTCVLDQRPRQSWRRKRSTKSKI